MIGRRNVQGAGAGPAIDAELAEVEAAIARTAAAGLPVEDRITAAAAELEACAAHFRQHGFAAMGAVPAEREFYQRRAVQGALMVIGRDALLRAERDRMTRAFQASGGFGLAPAERLADLQQRQRRLLAQRELQLRGAEGDGEILTPPSGRAGEMYLLADDDLNAIAGGDGRQAT
jgi:hypothetical protein